MNDAEVKAAQWTNTFEQSERFARDWFDKMQSDGIVDVEFQGAKSTECNNKGYWTFLFRHTVTGVVVELETHGIDNIDNYMKDNIFTPKIYWNDSSCSDPDIVHWLAPGYKVEQRIVKDAEVPA